VSVFTNPANASKENAAAYIEAVLGLVADRDGLTVLRATPAALRRHLDEVPDDRLRVPEREGKWSVGQVMRHLADSEIVWAWRMRQALSQDRPPLTGYDQDAWAERLGYAEADPAGSVREFEVLRAGNLWLLDRATPDDLGRVGVHVERGDESVAHMIRLYAGHDLLHLRQIERIRGTLGA